MKINKSKATYSTIVGIGETIKQLEKETKKKYLPLNRGLNSVVNIDLTNVVKNFDFNSNDLQHYTPNTGMDMAKEAINLHYFNSNIEEKNISITPGAMPALDLIFDILDVPMIYAPKLYWGSYAKIATIRKKLFDTYEELDEDFHRGSAIIICDPNNPTGKKEDDDYLIAEIERLSNRGYTIIFDSPYRKLFITGKDSFYETISGIENVLIVESFSKHIGLSGLRLGFIYSSDKEFNAELNIRLLYEFNGVTSFPQILIHRLFTDAIGLKIVREYRKKTATDIKKNIEWLNEKGYLANEFYGDELPMGIFSIVNVREEKLLDNRIGSVGLEKFCLAKYKEQYKRYSRICVSFKHKLVVDYFTKLEEK